MKLLEVTDHRPWPLPMGPWIMTQTWHDLLFAHWPVPPEVVRPMVPPGLEIDTFDGQAWLGIIPFRLTGIRLHFLPEVPLVARFPEINVRTYVKAGTKPGVLFLSLDTDNRWVVRIARRWFRLPYFQARVRFENEQVVRFASRRTHRNAPCAEFDACYGPTSTLFQAPRGTLEHWLTERYCYYAPGARNPARIYRCDIHHPPWQLQKAEASISTNTMALSHGIQLPPTEPLLLYAHYMKALIWPVRPS